LLRSLQLTDVPNLLAISVNEPETWEYSSKSAAGEEALKAYIEEAIAARSGGHRICFYSL
jgi:hypothetical protein